MTHIVKRDGTVHDASGKVLGSVVKDSEPTFASALFGADEKTVWIARDAQGNDLAARTFDTRKAAAKVVADAAAPLKVSNVETQTSWINGQAFISCDVSSKGNFYGVSKYASENRWVVDYYFPAGAIMPHFSNGSGSRVSVPYLLPEGLDAEVSAAVVKAAESV